MNASIKEIQLDPVAAYDCIAPDFARLSAQRQLYLDRIDQLVVSQIPTGSRSLLDVGAGDGTRAARIAQGSKLGTITLVEPSAGMRRNWPMETQGWAIRAEELHTKQGQFDVVTCLWNVLGHIAPAASRAEVLRQFARLLSPPGLIFIDVSHRYNARHYGVLATLLRAIGDYVLPNNRTGDVVAHWVVDGIRYATDGHVFTHSEFRALAQAAGLTIKKTFSVDYATGRIRESRFAGHLLYVLQRDV